jgi:hypothetical protein
MTCITLHIQVIHGNDNAIRINYEFVRMKYLFKEYNILIFMGLVYLVNNGRIR